MNDSYEQLRSAALRVLETAGHHRDLPDSMVQALQELHRAITGEISIDQVQDPGKHYLASYRYVGRVKFPVTLDQRATDWRRQLDNDRDIADAIPGLPVRNVVLTELRGMIVGSLLNELATRLTPGAAFGPGRDGLALVEIVRELSGEILGQTFVGYL